MCTTREEVYLGIGNIISRFCTPCGRTRSSDMSARPLTFDPAVIAGVAWNPRRWLFFRPEGLVSFRNRIQFLKFRLQTTPVPVLSSSVPVIVGAAISTRACKICTKPIKPHPIKGHRNISVSTSLSPPVQTVTLSCRTLLSEVFNVPPKLA